MISGCGEKDYQGKVLKEVSGDCIEVDEMELRMNSFTIQKEVKPSKPQGYYPHYKEQEGYQYYVIEGSLKNKGKQIKKLDGLKIMAKNGKSFEQAKLVFINEVESYFWEEIAPEATLSFYLFTLVEVGGKAPSEFRFYYDEDGKITKKQKEYDYEIVYQIPSVLRKKWRS